MTDYKLNAEKVTKIFGRRLIFSEINFEWTKGSIYGLAGSNGSGKSTLAKIITGIISPTKGKMIHQSNGEKVISEKLHNHIGFVSPYLILYDEFTAEENMINFAKIRGINYDSERVKSLMERFNIYDRRNDLLKEYSSGMKQRMRFIFAMLHSPDLLILDEPTSNLDAAGKSTVYDLIREESSNTLTIIASNEESDLSLCSEILQIENYKNSK